MAISDTCNCFESEVTFITSTRKQMSIEKHINQDIIIWSKTIYSLETVKKITMKKLGVNDQNINVISYL